MRKWSNWRGNVTPGRPRTIDITGMGITQGRCGWAASGIRCEYRGCEARPGESRLAAYEQLHGSPGEMDEGLFRKVLLGISCRDYEAAVEAVPGAIGLSKSTVSREFKKATAAKLKEFQERDLSGLRRGGTRPGRQELCRGRDGRRARGDDQGGQGLPRVRPDRHGERRGDPILPSESEGVRSRPVGRSARGDRWSPRSPERRPGGLQGTGAHPAVPVAQAGERDLVSAESGAEGLAPAVCSAPTSGPRTKRPSRTSRPCARSSRG